jgi:murein DD-endopeptidase MepM/ murein hydrolase activator NlpD
VWGLTSASPAEASPRWADWPLKGIILRLPVIPVPNWKPGHRGIDLAAEPGATVRAPVSGNVKWVGTINGVTSLTIVDFHGYRHTLLPVETTAQIGDQVARGDVVATVGGGTHCKRFCLHWGIRKARAYIDPRWLAPPLIYRLPS